MPKWPFRVCSVISKWTESSVFCWVTITCAMERSMRIAYFAAFQSNEQIGLTGVLPEL
jgi:hypothetical protein